MVLCVNQDLWSSSADTPLRLLTGGELPVNAEKGGRFPSTVEYDAHGTNDVPIHLKTGVEKQPVLDDAVSQIREIKDFVYRGN